MIIFKTFMRILRKNRNTLIMPISIFVGFIFLSQMNAVKQNETFEMIVPPVSIVNEDAQGTVSNGLLEYLSDKVSFVDLKNKNIDDAIFYREVYFAMTIPQGFSEDVISGTQEPLNSQMVVDGAEGYLIESMINEYLSNVSAFIESGYSPEDAVTAVQKSSTTQSHVTILDKVDNTDAIINSFSHMELYPVMLTVTSIITTLLVVFNSVKIRTRSSISATTHKNQNLQLLLATLLTGHVLWIVLKIISFIFLREFITMETFGLRLFNSYLFLLFTLAVSFLVSKLVTTSTAQIAILNGVTLGLSFLSGVFVPKQFLSASIQNVAKLFPVYWNVEISDLITAGQTSFSDLMIPVAIQIGFTLVIVIAALIIARERDFKSVSLTVNTH